MEKLICGMEWKQIIELSKINIYKKLTNSQSLQIKKYEDAFEMYSSKFEDPKKQ